MTQLPAGWIGESLKPSVGVIHAPIKPEKRQPFGIGPVKD